MDFKPISFEGFEGREESLKKIKRYNMYKVMFFRTNVDIHTKRMEWIAEELSKYIKKDTEFDLEKLKLLCRIHDDMEIITGDHQLGRKLYTMKKEELEILEQEEETARKALATRWPKRLQGYDYYALLQEAGKKETIEAQIMKLIDRLDAFGESLHEIYSGNACFLSHPELPEGVNPVQTYTRILNDGTYKKLNYLFDSRHPLLSFPLEINQEEIVKKAKLPDKDSILQKSGNSHYDAWRDITLKYSGQEGLQQLTVKIE